MSWSVGTEGTERTGGGGTEIDKSVRGERRGLEGAVKEKEWREGRRVEIRRRERNFIALG